MLHKYTSVAAMINNASKNLQKIASVAAEGDELSVNKEKYMQRFK